jgi:hypothetical protein
MQRLHKEQMRIEEEIPKMENLNRRIGLGKSRILNALLGGKRNADWLRRPG